MYKFSIIIPNYNEEKDIKRCLESIFNQTINKKEGNDRQNRVKALVDLESEYSKSQIISMKSVVLNAITQGIATEDVGRIDNEEHRKSQENQIEGGTKDD